jgi:hypothetical protein
LDGPLTNLLSAKNRIKVKIQVWWKFISRKLPGRLTSYFEWLFIISIDVTVHKISSIYTLVPMLPIYPQWWQNSWSHVWLIISRQRNEIKSQNSPVCFTFVFSSSCCKNHLFWLTRSKIFFPQKSKKKLKSKKFPNFGENLYLENYKAD